MNDDERDARLRDQFAMAALSGFTARDDVQYYITSDPEGPLDKEILKKKIERISQRAYEIADEMRKARLSVFD
jgi:hypothetical protein